MLGDPLLEPLHDLLQRLLGLLPEQAVAALEDVLLGELLLQLGGQVEEVVLLVEQALGASLLSGASTVRLVEPAHAAGVVQAGVEAVPGGGSRRRRSRGLERGRSGRRPL